MLKIYRMCSDARRKAFSLAMFSADGKKESCKLEDCDRVIAERGRHAHEMAVTSEETESQLEFFCACTCHLSILLPLHCPSPATSESRQRNSRPSEGALLHLAILSIPSLRHTKEQQQSHTLQRYLQQPWETSALLKPACAATQSGPLADIRPSCNLTVRTRTTTISSRCAERYL